MIYFFPLWCLKSCLKVCVYNRLTACLAGIFYFKKGVCLLLNCLLVSDSS